MTEPQPNRDFEPEFLSSILPVVLVGGQSRRFGRDKLLEPWRTDEQGVQPLVEYPIKVLRSVFGPRVHLVGTCNPRVAQLADGMIPDLFPGIGPLGGIASGLSFAQSSIFVLAGDMPAFTPHNVAAILRASLTHSTTHAVTAFCQESHPCAALYRITALPDLLDRIANKQYKLMDALPLRSVYFQPIPHDSLTNVNRPGDLPAAPP